jgi:hypothetical protein
VIGTSWDDDLRIAERGGIGYTAREDVYSAYQLLPNILEAVSLPLEHLPS